MGKLRDLHVCVCVPSNGSWQAEFGKSLALLFSKFSLRPPAGYGRAKITLLGVEGSMLSQQREMLVKRALQEKATHILFVDSDMAFPMDIVHRLLAHKKEFVAANCTTRVSPSLFVAHDLNGDRLDSRGKHGLQEVQHVGLAVALIDTNVFRRLRPPLFLMDWIPDLGVYCGEDVYFCQLLDSVGVRQYIDHDLSVQIKHVGTMAFGAHTVTTNQDEGVKK